MTENRSIRSFVREWLDERPEYAEQIPVDQVANAMRDSVPLGVFLKNTDGAIKGAVREEARARELVHVPSRSHEGSIYAKAAQLSLGDFIETLRERRQGERKYSAANRKLAREFLAAHPEVEMTFEDLWRETKPIAV